MSISIRIANKEDIPKLIQVYSDWKDYKGILPDELIEVDTPESLFKYFDGSNETRKYLLALDNEEPLGACYVDLSFVSLKSIRLGDMMVRKRYRHNGVGSKLVDAVIDFAIKNDVKKIWLWTQEELAPAIELYKSKGFILEGTQRQQFCNKDALLFGLILDKQP